jgi:hypothetical protein
VRKYACPGQLIRIFLHTGPSISSALIDAFGS